MRLGVKGLGMRVNGRGGKDKDGTVEVHVPGQKVCFSFQVLDLRVWGLGSGV